MKAASILTAVIIFISAATSMGASCNSNVSASGRNARTVAPSSVQTATVVETVKTVSATR